MKILILAIFILTTGFASGQQKIYRVLRPKQFTRNVLVDSSRKDFSLLDRTYLIAKSIDPDSWIQPSNDSLLVTVKMPSDTMLADEVAQRYANYCFYSLYTAFQKDNRQYRYLGVQLYLDSNNRGTCWYILNHQETKLTLTEKIQLFLIPNLWTSTGLEPTVLGEPQIYKGKKTMVLIYHIDTTDKFAQIPYLEWFCQTASAVITDLIYRNTSKINNPYRELLVIFSNSRTNRFIHFWRHPINDEERLKLYSVKYYETYLRHQAQSINQKENPGAERTQN